MIQAERGELAMARTIRTANGWVALMGYVAATFMLFVAWDSSSAAGSEVAVLMFAPVCMLRVTAGIASLRDERRWPVLSIPYRALQVPFIVAPGVNDARSLGVNRACALGSHWSLATHGMLGASFYVSIGMAAEIIRIGQADGEVLIGAYLVAAAFLVASLRRYPARRGRTSGPSADRD
ncbi:MAG: hypothetical protein JNK67_09220 [Alphaproteobacteria bacterium]|nr:hypothetical protein [Alphaproteobacteria bacterium]